MHADVDTAVGVERTWLETQWCEYWEKAEVMRAFV